MPRKMKRRTLRDERVHMPRFTVLSRKDAFIDYIVEVEAETAEAAVELAYEGGPDIRWEFYGTVEFDARRVVALDDDWQEIEGTERGDFA
jgi:hypothetical protein